MSKHQEWISPKDRNIWHENDIWADKNGLEYAIADFFRKNVTVLMERNHYSEEKAKEVVSRDYARRIQGENGSEWQLHTRIIKDFAKQWHESRQWLNSTGLKEYGITKKLELLEGWLQEYAEGKKQLMIEAGVDTSIAAKKVEDAFVRQGKNRMGRPSWQLHRSALEDFREWLENEHKWISSTDPKRLQNYQITTWGSSVDRILSELHDREIENLKSQGMDTHKATRTVETTMVRPAMNSHGKPVWQVHPDYTEKLALRLKFVSVINGKRMAEQYGITVSVDSMAKAAERLYKSEIERRVKSGVAPLEAIKYVNENTVTHGVTVSGKIAWQVHESEVDKLKNHVGKEQQWVSASNLKKYGIGNRGEIVNLALAYLYEKRVQKLVSLGKREDDAQHIISTREVRLTIIEGSPPLWEVNRSMLSELKDLLASPDKAWQLEARKLAENDAKKVLSRGMHGRNDDPLVALQRHIRNGVIDPSSTWAARVVDRSESRNRSR